MLKVNSLSAFRDNFFNAIFVAMGGAATNISITFPHVFSLFNCSSQITIVFAVDRLDRRADNEYRLTIFYGEVVEDHFWICFCIGLFIGVSPRVIRNNAFERNACMSASVVHIRTEAVFLQHITNIFRVGIEATKIREKESDDVGFSRCARNNHDKDLRSWCARVNRVSCCCCI